MRTVLGKVAAAAALGGLLAAGPALAQTRVIVLGTGTPVPDAERSGPGLAVIADGEAYLFDAGGGMVQRMIEAWQTMGAEELYPTKVKHLFLSHLHSDHTLDYPELAATYWWRREEKLNAYGPEGLQAMTDGYYEMQAIDINLRTSGNQPVKDPALYQVDVHEIGDDGVIYEGNGVTVEAFSVNHGDIHPAYGYRITTPGKTVVFSGDTTYSPALAEMAKGADVLVHEVISEEGWKALTPEWQAYHHSSHTLTSELAQIANEARPGVLVLTHILHYGAPIETAKTEIEALYDGKVVLADDLDEF
ncbi:MBL fold metallo-hydrolase [Poseidonocella sp. HB161398]|uniref:MBL fold metallo-hydrolase n=1 Tax=Poseidonocella sp. HB161398 TaxID=2320855 RepID=UPI0011096DE6|nr:MBL fold metallo-hydrolase [Poseidonocella sp. HB161398]